MILERPCCCRAGHAGAAPARGIDGDISVFKSDAGPAGSSYGCMPTGESVPRDHAGVSVRPVTRMHPA